ncbi:MAG: HyaD/HybD family hydrogenase maturation endopeptidase [Deferribacterales bacterium]
MKVVVFGAGNLLLSDEGLGVHLVKRMNEKYAPSDDVEFYDGGTMGILATHKLEETKHVIIVDSLEAEGEAGELRVYQKEDIMLEKIPAKMSPHQIGLQEVLTLSELRGKAPESITFYGVIPASLDSDVELSPEVHKRMEEIDEMIVSELKTFGIDMCPA